MTGHLFTEFIEIELEEGVFTPESWVVVEGQIEAGAILWGIRATTRCRDYHKVPQDTRHGLVVT